MPAQEYGERVTFLAVAWKGTMEATAERAAELIPSGAVAWGLDQAEEVFAFYDIPYQPASVLVTGEHLVFDRWPGVMSEGETRAAIEGLIASAG